MDVLAPSLRTDGLFPSQAGLVDAGFLESDDHWLICAPTGSGKTLMGEWAIEHAWGQGLSAAYVAPLRAIVEERLADWGTRYGDRIVKAYTGDTRAVRPPSRDEHLLLFTPEKLAAYVSAWKSHLDWLSGLGVLIVDEMHLLGDPSRGAALEGLLGRIERVNPFIRIVGLSATLSNAREVADWLGARLYETTWRPVPITHRLRRYKRAADKPELLLEEILQTRADGGRTLVFVNSRRRAQQLADHLAAQGLAVGFTHAGLGADVQQRTHAQMRRGELDVLVATSTLEMGVNLPARKVVIYDNYAFEGDTFRPLRVQRYLQFAGRAGRPGLDDRGEAVLFAPVWDGSAQELIVGRPDPVRSALFASPCLAREVLGEVSSRLSISEHHLEINFGRRTLWRAQGGLRDLGPTVRTLLDGGLLKKTEKDERTWLTHTALGRIATQMSLSPDTVVLMARLFEEIDDPSGFDLLLAACLCAEVTPKLGFNFEEIDYIGDIVQTVSSRLLDRPTADVATLRGSCTDQALLSAVKCAALLEACTRLEDDDTLAERHDAFPADLRTLRRNAAWVMQAAQRIFAVLNRRRFLQMHEGEEDPGRPLPSPHEKAAAALALMIEHAIPRGAIGLVDIQGIGARRARQLCTEGVFTAADVAQLPEAMLAEVVSVGPKTAQRILASARRQAAWTHVVPLGPTATSAGPSPVSPSNASLARAPVDPYRLRRALDLQVDHASAEVVRVSGGAEPHTVRVHEDVLHQSSYVCDCADFARGQSLCKHVIRARLALHDDAELKPWLAFLSRPQRDLPLRYALAHLWMNAGRVMNTYLERPGTAGAVAVPPTAPGARRWQR